MNERDIQEIAMGVVLEGCAIRDLESHYDEESNDVVFVVGYMNEYSTESAWVVRYGVFDCEDGEYYTNEISYQTADEDEDQLDMLSHDDRHKIYLAQFSDRVEKYIYN